MDSQQQNSYLSRPASLNFLQTRYEMPWPWNSLTGPLGIWPSSCSTISYTSTSIWLRKGCTKQNRHAIQIWGHHLLQKECCTVHSQLSCLPWCAPAYLIIMANGATLKLENQKNVENDLQLPGSQWQWLPLPSLCTRMLFLHLRHHGAVTKAFFSSYWTEGTKANVMAEIISRALKLVAVKLKHPTNKGIPIKRINTHSLHSRGANALALTQAGYLNMQIQIGSWPGRLVRLLTA